MTSKYLQAAERGGKERSLPARVSAYRPFLSSFRSPRTSLVLSEKGPGLAVSQARANNNHAPLSLVPCSCGKCQPLSLGGWGGGVGVGGGKIDGWGWGVNVVSSAE